MLLCYGLDLRPKHSRAISSPEKFSAAAGSLPADSTTICSLLRELNSLPGDFCIRLLYTHPAHWTDELIRRLPNVPSRALRGHPAPAHPRKHARTDAARNFAAIHRDLIRKIRAGMPGIALRTTFIVGFPGETEAEFSNAAGFHPRDEVRAARRVRLLERGWNARGKNGRPDFRPGETASPQAGDGSATQNRPAGFRIFCRPRNQSAD